MGLPGWAEIEYRYVRPVIAVGCAYEVVAIATDRVPTISKMIGWLYSRPPGRLALWLGYGWLTCHLCERVIVTLAEEIADAVATPED